MKLDDDHTGSLKGNRAVAKKDARMMNDLLKNVEQAKNDEFKAFK